MGHFHKRQKNIPGNLLRLKTEQFHHTDFLELQFDTATSIIQSLRMIKARGCKQRFKSDPLYLVRNCLVPATIRIYMQYYYTAVVVVV